MTTTSYHARRGSTYNNGQPYTRAKGRSAPTDAVVDRFATVHPVVQGRPSHAEFVKAIVRELKIRFYRRPTIKSYRNALVRFLRWVNVAPHQVTREDVRCYLELLVDGGAGDSHVSGTLSAIRTAFDKMCGRQVTLGLQTPRRRKRLPIVPSVQEVVRLLDAAVSLFDKLLIGMIYATGLRVSEIARLRWRDLDFDRGVINVWQGKGNSDRVVMLPDSYRPLLLQLSEHQPADAWVFPSPKNPRRHVSSRTIQRIVKRAAAIAGIKKEITPHKLRHGFATHLIERGTDIRFIQELLGHRKLETTRIYTHVTAVRRQGVISPLDQLASKGEVTQPTAQKQPPVGRIKLVVEPQLQAASPCFDVQLIIDKRPHAVVFEGIVVREQRPGWLTIDVPPTEHWEQQRRQLTDAQRERMDTAEFYELLRQQITVRTMALKSN